jgi:superfamily II DNA/RNA helicase
MKGGRADRGRDWTPREERPTGRGGYVARDDRRDDRAPRSGRDDRAPRSGRDDRAPRRYDNDRAERSPRRFEADRFEKPVRRFSNDTERDARRADRVERDRDRDRSFDRARSESPSKKAFVEDVVLERLKGVDEADAVIENSFEDMNLHPKLIASLQGMGAVTPFPIQAATIPSAIAGRDVLGRGKTGSGKTVAFSVPIVTKLIAGGSVQRRPGQARALILAPTRELADQIDRTIKGLARPVGFFTVCIYGGVPQRRQEVSMSRGTDVIVATPGRLEDLMAQGIVDLSAVETIVIDEADHMCDLGFIEPVRRIMRACGDAQKLLFSATLDKEVDSLVREFLPDPYIYEVAEEEEDHTNITHRVLVVDEVDRSAILLRLVQGHGKSLIFARTKMTAERLSESLTAAGVPAARLHGDLNQNQRNRNLERFHSGSCRVMVATDVAARGIHVDDVALVIQVDPPLEYKTYLHRSGRTGRAGKDGTVVTLIPRSRRRKMEDLLRRADRDGIFTDVRPAHPLLEQLAGPIAPPPVAESLDFGDSRGGSRGEGRGDRGDRGGRGRSDRAGRDGRGARGDAKGARGEGRGARGEGRGDRGEGRGDRSGRAARPSTGGKRPARPARERNS